ncbi:MAG: GNAT family N-acetyltransferase [Bacillota bacterium]
MTDIAVKPSHQGKGYGRKLMGRDYDLFEM